MTKKSIETDKDVIIADLRTKLAAAEKHSDFNATQWSRSDKHLRELKVTMNALALQMRAMLSASANNWTDDDIPF